VLLVAYTSGLEADVHAPGPSPVLVLHLRKVLALMARRAARVDLNHQDIVAALKVVGASVQSLAASGSGCPDLLVGHRRRNYLIEVKGRLGKLTPDQVVWHREWQGMTVAIVRSPEEALEVLGLDKHGRKR